MTVSRTLIAAAALVLLLLTGCGTIKKIFRYGTVSMHMQGSDLLELYGPGRDFDYSWASGETGSVTFDKSGSASIDYGGKTDTGSWTIRENQLCTKWRELAGSEERCYRLHRRKKGAKYKLYNAEGGSYHAAAFPR